MNLEQMNTLLYVIRGYNFAYKATKQKCYLNTRNKLIKQLRTEITAYQADKTLIFNIAA